MKPVEMTKMSVTGPKTQLQNVIEALYRLEVMDIDEYQGKELEKGNPFEEAEELSRTLVDIRSLLSKIPEKQESKEVGFNLNEIQDALEELDQKVDDLKARRSSLDNQVDTLEEDIEFFRKLEGSGIRYRDLQESKRLKVYVGKLDAESLTDKCESDRFEVFEGKNASVVVYSKRDSGKIESCINENSRKEYKVPELDVSGSINAVVNQLEKKRNDIEAEKEKVEEDIQGVSDSWRDRLEQAEEFLTEKVEKAEAPINFATTEKAFVAQGWVPSDKYEEVEEVLAEASEGKIHVQKEEGENPPVKHSNSRPVKPFESLTDLVSVPKYNELDPSFVLLLTFPLMFGFMIGDAGYGFTTLAVFYLGYKYIEGAREIFKSLMYASVATILFGLAFGDAFGYVIFGHHSELAAVTGIHLFEQIPILWHRAEHLGQVFTISAIVGFFHVNAGYMLGFYNEYSNHGFVEAFLEKGSWFLLQISVALLYFYGAVIGVPALMVSVALLFKGEGVEGVVEIPSLLSNILSYLRIFGVSVAAVSLAAVVNALAEPLFQMGSIIGIVAGIALLVFGHTFNTFIKIMEGFLQGIRLHYVEMFGKFYEGGGRKYMPFGTRDLS